MRDWIDRQDPIDWSIGVIIVVLAMLLLMIAVTVTFDYARQCEGIGELLNVESEYVKGVGCFILQPAGRWEMVK